MSDPRDNPASPSDLVGARAVICPGGTFMLISVHNLRGVFLPRIQDYVCVFSTLEKFRAVFEPTAIIEKTERARGDTLRLGDPIKDPKSLISYVKLNFLGSIGIALDPCMDENQDWHLREVVETES